MVGDGAQVLEDVVGMAVADGHAAVVAIGHGPGGDPCIAGSGHVDGRITHMGGAREFGGLLLEANLRLNFF